MNANTTIDKHLTALRMIKQQYTNGNYISTEDYIKLQDAMIFFEQLHLDVKIRLIKEGVI